MKQPEDGESYEYVQIEQEETFSVRFDLSIPSNWEINGSVAMDRKRMEDEIFSTKHMEYYTFLLRKFDVPETAIERNNNAEKSYYTWEETSATQDGYGVIYTHVAVPNEDETGEMMDEKYWFLIYFLTYSDDRAGYYEETILPIVNGMEFEFLPTAEGMI